MPLADDSTPEPDLKVVWCIYRREDCDRALRSVVHESVTAGPPKLLSQLSSGIPVVALFRWLALLCSGAKLGRIQLSLSLASG